MKCIQTGRNSSPNKEGVEGDQRNGTNGIFLLFFLSPLEIMAANKQRQGWASGQFVPVSPPFCSEM